MMTKKKAKAKPVRKKKKPDCVTKHEDYQALLDGYRRKGLTDRKANMRIKEVLGYAD